MTRTASSPASPPALAIVTVPIDALYEDPANARLHGERNLDAIMASLRRFGQVEPLVVKKGDRRIIGGNGRHVAMKALGWTECQVVEVDVSDTQATALGIALNRTAELAEWDEGTLARLMGSLRDDGFDLADVGFDDAELRELFAGLDDAPATSDVTEDTAPEPLAVAYSKPGDLWLLGDHRLLCGSSTSPEDVRRLMAGERAVLFATDPPYLVNYDGTNHPKGKANKDHSASYGVTWDDADAEGNAELWLRFCEVARSRGRPRGRRLVLLVRLGAPREARGGVDEGRRVRAPADHLGEELGRPDLLLVHVAARAVSDGLGPPAQAAAESGQEDARHRLVARAHPRRRGGRPPDAQARAGLRHPDGPAHDAGRGLLRALQRLRHPAHRGRADGPALLRDGDRAALCRRRGEALVPAHRPARHPRVRRHGLPARPPRR
jgi:hypothetical protein